MRPGENGKEIDFATEVAATLRILADYAKANRAKLDELDSRLQRLEQSDFALNRDEYQNTMRQLHESQPEVPMFAE